MQNVIVCKVCTDWKFHGEEEWKKMTKINFFDFRFKPTEYGISPVVCKPCQEVSL